MPLWLDHDTMRRLGHEVVDAITMRRMAGHAHPRQRSERASLVARTSARRLTAWHTAR
jgi:hypothetical protein